MLSLRKLLNKPKLTEGRPLALFYYCNSAVNHQMQELNRLMRTAPDNLDRRSTLIHQLKEAQHSLMNVIMSIVQEAIPTNQASRDFRAKYPDDVLLDQINGPIWFGAECIAAGSHIANHEADSDELRPYAIELSKVITKLRNALKEQCFIDRDTYPKRLKELLQAFDELWADFEFRYVSLMCSVKTELQYHQQQDVVVLFCEATLRAIRRKYLTYDMIEMMDPSAMFAIPRLAILCGLVVYPEGPLDPSKPSKEMPVCFRAYKQLLSRIKELLGYLDESQLTTLERALCSAEGLGTLKRKKQLKTAADVTQTGGLVSPPEISIDSTSSIPPPLPPRPVSTPSAITQTAPSLQPAATRGEPVTITITSELQQRRPFSAATSESESSSLSQQRSLSYNDLDSRGSSATVFEPTPIVVVNGIPGSSGDGALSDGATGVDPALVSSSAEEEAQFPNLGVNQPVANDLPSRSQAALGSAGSAVNSDVSMIGGVHSELVAEHSTPKHQPTAVEATPSVSTSAVVSVAATRTSSSNKSSKKSGPSPSKSSGAPKPRRTKQKGPAGFPSAEDLMHRLFVAISGVADQLQSNFAKDLRVILKHVFTVCQSEPEADEGGESLLVVKSSALQVPEPCTPNPHSSLITSMHSQRFSFTTATLSIEGRPSWVPDSDSPSCAACHENFSWKKRRHHCRSCGSVVCARCSSHSLPLPSFGINKSVRVCSTCYIQHLSQVTRTLAPITVQVQ